MDSPAVVEQPATRAVAVRSELTIDELVDQVRTIQMAMDKVMREDEHYGVIPGTGTKPTLLKAGAEKLLLLFRLDPEYEIEKDWDGDHLTVTSTCTLYHIPTGNRVASGVAMCSTRESKYAWRKADRRCPNCGATAIIKGKAEYGGGWLCFAKKGGCGHKWPNGAAVIEGQETARVPNPELPDTYNTVVKMACKRALTAAVLNGTAASDIFTQDLDDLPAAEGEPGMAEGDTPSEDDAASVSPPRPGAEPGSPSAETEEPEEKKVTEPQRRKIRALLSKLVEADVFSEDRFRDGLEAAYGTRHTSKLTRAQATDLIDRLGKLEAALDEETETRGEE